MDSNMSGPDYVFETDRLTTWDADGYTKIRMTGEAPANMQPRSLISVIKEKCREAGAGTTAFRVKIDGKWVRTTYDDYYRQIQTVARAFIKLGLEERHSVCISGFNSPEWFLSEMGCIFAGGMVSFLSDTCKVYMQVIN